MAIKALILLERLIRGYEGLVFLRKHWSPGVFFSFFQILEFFVESRS